MHRTLSAAWFKSERSQSATEFALIAPVLLLILFGILDFGRGVYYLVTLDQAVNEGARVAIRAPTPPNLDYFAPNDLQGHQGGLGGGPGAGADCPRQRLRQRTAADRGQPRDPR